MNKLRCELSDGAYDKLLHDGHISSTAGNHHSSCPTERDQKHRICTEFISYGAKRVWGSGLTCSFLASLIFSFSALFVKLTGGRVPVLEVCLARSAISFCLTILLMKSARMTSPIFGQRKNRLILTFRGCCGALSMTSYYVGLFLLPLGDAVTIKLIGPAVTAVVARVVLKEPLGYRGAAGCVVSMVGVVVLSHPPFLFGGSEHWGRERAAGTVAVVAAAVLGSGSVCTIRFVGSREPAAVIAMWFHTCTMLLAAVPLIVGFPHKLVLLLPKDGAFMLGVAGTSFVAQLLSTRGLQMVVAAKAAAMGFTSVFYSYLFGGIFFNEHITLMGVLGVALILVGVLMVTMKSPEGNICSTPAAAAAAKPTAAAPAGPSTQLAELLGVSRTGSGVAGELLVDASCKSSCKTHAVDDDGGDQLPLLPEKDLSADKAIGQAAQQEGALLLGADAAELIRAKTATASTQQEAEAPSEQPAALLAGTVPLSHEPVSTAISNAAHVGQVSQPSRIFSAFLRSQLAETLHRGPAELSDAEIEQQLACVAAEAAAALGGELCPVNDASLAASRQASFLAALQISRRASRLTAEAAATALETGTGAGSLGGAAAAGAAGDGCCYKSGCVDGVQGLHSIPILSGQVSNWLGSSLLGVLPGGVQQQQQAERLGEALLDRSAVSPEARGQEDRDVSFSGQVLSARDAVGAHGQQGGPADLAEGGVGAAAAAVAAESDSSRESGADVWSASRLGRASSGAI